jgi:hypothetical protein
MVAKKKKPKHHETLSLMQEVAVFLEKTRLGDYMDLMARPHRLAWLNFWAGVWRGLGMAVGTVFLFALILWGLKFALHHAGGVPWIGQQVEEFLAWILTVIERHQTTE